MCARIILIENIHKKVIYIFNNEIIWIEIIFKKHI